MPPARPLFEIADDLARLNALLDEVDGDLSRLGEMEPAVTAWFDSLAGEQAAKLDGYVNLLRRLEMEAAAARAEAEQYQATGRARESRSAYLKDRLVRHLLATGQPKVRTATGRTLAVQANGGALPVVFDAMTMPDPAGLDPRFQSVTVSANTAAIRAALEGGEQIPFASLGARGNHLRIR